MKYNSKYVFLFPLIPLVILLITIILLVGTGSFRPVMSNTIKIDDWTYYTTFVGGRGLYKYNEQTKEKVKLSSYEAATINVYEDWVYFTKMKSGSIYRVAIDGTDQQKIIENCYYFYFIGDKIFYKSYNNLLYRIDLNGENKELFINRQIKGFHIEDKYLNVRLTNDKRYLVDLDTRELIPVK